MNAKNKEFSRRAVWLAYDSEYGGRLTEIMLEHVALAKALVMDRDSFTETDREIFAARIAQLRQERSGLIQQFEGGTTDETDNA